MSVIFTLGAPRARWLAPCALLGALVLSMTAWSGESAEITVDNFTFAPAVLTVSAGTEVKWTNHDDIPHTIVLPALSTRSKTLDTDGTFSYTFTKAGTYTYLCGLHPHMTAKIVVK